MVRKKMNVEAQQELTKAELELMQVIWDKEKVLVHDILDVLPEPKPAYNTVSTIVRILEQYGKEAPERIGSYVRSMKAAMEGLA